MNAMSRFTVKSLRANRVRTVVTILGVALAAALLTAVLTSFTSLTSYLYHAEEAIAGSWMAQISSSDRQQLQEQLDDAINAEEVTGWALLQDVGFARLSEAQQDLYGPSTPVLNMSGDVTQLCAIRPSEGRLPQGPDEVMLPSTWQEHGDTRLDGQITLPIGSRVAVLAPGHEGEAAHPVEVGAETLGIDGTTTAQIQAGSHLDSSIGYLDAAADGGILNEEVVDTTERTFTVVGFYDRSSYAASYAVGLAAFTADDPATTGLASAYITMDGMSTTEEVEERTEELFPQNSAIHYHTSMLRYMGVRGTGAVWSTFFGIAGTLATVIVIACVSLIYNAFAISVAERQRQLGLLSSVGASKKQLRRAVLFEALLVAAAGIPLGILIGFGGCAITFACLGPAIDAIVSNVGVPFATVMEPWVVGIAAALTLATVLVSAFVPAWRAGRTSAIEALRNVGSRRISKKAQARAAKRTDGSRVWKQQSIAGRLFGIGGMLARINAKRGVSKGAAAAASLALAIILLMTAGSLNTFLGTLIEVAGADYRYDIGIGSQYKQTKDESLAEQAATYAQAWDELCQAPGAQPVGWALYDAVDLSVPPAMADAGLRQLAADQADTYSASSAQAMGPADEGTHEGEGEDAYQVMANLFFLEDDAFDAYARSLGADPARFHDAAHPSAIANNSIYGNDGSMYQLNRVFSEPGSASVNACAVDIAVLAEDTPPIVSAFATPALIMPLSMIETPGLAVVDPLFNAGFNVESDDHKAVAEELSNIASNCFRVSQDTAIGWCSINDHLEEADSNRTLVMIINVFCLLFTGILALIAMANVFNTITNSLILRRREFAVMKSAGMSDRQFRAMIIDECARFGIQGLIPGMIVSVVVSYLLFFMVTQSLSGIAFNLPWAYVGLAIAMTAAAMTIAVAFGMHRCRADNVVEALRMDSI